MRARGVARHGVGAGKPGIRRGNQRGILVPRALMIEDLLELGRSRHALVSRQVGEAPQITDLGTSQAFKARRRLQQFDGFRRMGALQLGNGAVHRKLDGIHQNVLGTPGGTILALLESLGGLPRGGAECDGNRADRFGPVEVREFLATPTE